MLFWDRRVIRQSLNPLPSTLSLVKHMQCAAVSRLGISATLDAPECLRRSARFDGGAGKRLWRSRSAKPLQSDVTERCGRDENLNILRISENLDLSGRLRDYRGYKSFRVVLTYGWIKIAEEPSRLNRNAYVAADRARRRAGRPSSLKASRSQPL